MKSIDSATPTGGGQKLPYAAPRLTIHGDLRTITAAKGGNKTDSGKPKTWSTSSP